MTGSIGKPCQQTLSNRGFSVSAFAGGRSFLEDLKAGIEAQVAILDWGLPDMSAYELLGALQEPRIKLSIVFFGLSIAERDLQALSRGAVDFIDKSRGIEVLAHRLRVIIEAQQNGSFAAKARIERHGDLTSHPSTARALWRQRDIGLTVTEYKIVSELVSHKGQARTYRAIYDIAHYAGFVAGSGADGYRVNVRAVIKRIRKKFLAIDPGFAEIENFFGAISNPDSTVAQEFEPTIPLRTRMDAVIK